MKLKIISLALALFFVMVLVPTNTQAGYTMAISGKSNFVATPYQADIFNSTEVYVRIYLNEYSPSSLDIDLSVEGTLAQYITFPEYNGITPSFTLFPGQNKKIFYELDFPVSSPGKYYGAILAVGNPPETEISDGAGAIGKPAVSINIVVDVPSKIQIYDYETSRPGGFPDQQWSDWGDDWTTDFSIVNGGGTTFNGICNVTLSNSTGVLEYDLFNITNLSVGGSIDKLVNWTISLPLNDDYEFKAVINSDMDEKMEEESVIIHIPSPADIISVVHTPSQVFRNDTVAVYAIAASSDSTLTLHYQVNNGSEATVPMTFTSSSGEYSASIPSQEIGSTIFYWVTSVNGVFSDRSPDGLGTYSYYVFSPDVPDLTINEDTIQFIPIDPRTETVNVTDSGGNPAQITIFFTIGNIGRGDASDVPFSVFDGETAIWNGTVASIAGQSNSAFLQFTWNPTEGEHILRFAVDPDDTILELDENNNYYTIDAFTIHGPEPYVPPKEPEPASSILPYIVIPILLFIIIFFLFFLRRRRTINVTVSETKAFTSPRDGTMLWKYTCSYGGGMILGKTKSTDMHADTGAIIQVQPIGLHEKEDGTIAWKDAEVKKVLEDGTPDEEDAIRKLIRKDEK